jgi:hypothetical protein
MEKYGYTGFACIPMALVDAIELGKIKRGDLVVMISSGLGWHQAAVAVRCSEAIATHGLKSLRPFRCHRVVKFIGLNINDRRAHSALQQLT